MVRFYNWFLISVAGIVSIFPCRYRSIPALILLSSNNGFFIPNKITKTLIDLRSQMNPAQVNWQKEQGEPTTIILEFSNNSQTTVDDRAGFFRHRTK